MPDTAVAPATTSAEGTAGNAGTTGTPKETPAGEVKKEVANPWTPREFELEVKGQKQKIKFETEDQLKAILQKAVYADHVIKESAQKIKGTEALMEKIKTPQGLKEVLNDPAIGMDVKKFALDIVKEMMDDEKLTPEQKKARDNES